MTATVEQKYKTIVTPTGQAIIADAIANNRNVNIKYVSLGDGGGAAYIPEPGQAALKNELHQAEANTVFVHASRPDWVVVELYVPEATGGWWIREIAIKDMEIIGDIRLLPHPHSDLPFGWVFANGERYSHDSEIGTALAALPDTFRSAWGIVATDVGINVPNLIGFFLRAVNGTGRLPGSIEDWAWPQIGAGANSTASTSGPSGTVGSFSPLNSIKDNAMAPSTSGAFAYTPLGETFYGDGSAHRGETYGRIDLNLGNIAMRTTVNTSVSLSQSGTKSNEVRPTNIGMTPSIYLGV